MLLEFWRNLTHNLFKPLLLFFYFGFFIVLAKVPFEFPHAVYQGLTMYLLLAIGWRGGEELANIDFSQLGGILGFIITGFVLNLLIGALAYFLLKRMSKIREIDRATVAGYYGSDSAGTFATCMGVLASVGIAFDAYMPVMLAIMEIPGCLVALFLVARLRRKGMDADGTMPWEPGYAVPAGQAPTHRHVPGRADTSGGLAVELSAEDRDDLMEDVKSPLLSAALLREVLLNPGLCLLIGGVVIGF